MAKLFTPEDFDKPSDSKSGLLKKILIGITVVVVIGLAVWGISSANKTNEAHPVNEGVITTPIDTTNTIEVPIIDGPDKGPTQIEDGGDPPTPPQPVSVNIEKEAINVIRGDYGNNPQRRQKLGANYQPIQDRVNQLKKEGFF